MRHLAVAMAVLSAVACRPATYDARASDDAGAAPPIVHTGACCEEFAIVAGSPCAARRNRGERLRPIEVPWDVKAPSSLTRA